MNPTKYAELLLRPEWKVRRWQIMQRDHNRCRNCQAETTLEVHHLEYIEGRMPWDYDGSYLVTLFAACHATLHLKQMTNRMIKQDPFKMIALLGKSKMPATGPARRLEEV